MTGRPHTFDAKKVETILTRLSEGESLRAICAEKGMPPESTFRRWVIDDEHGLSARYARARELQADALFDECQQIADECKGNPERGSDLPAIAKLKIDTRKWMAGKLRPKVYGDKFVAEVTTDADTAALLAAASKRVSE